MHTGLLFAPIPLFPVIGVYCKGVLCMITDPHICVVSVHRSFFKQYYLYPPLIQVTFFALVLGCLITLNLCVFYRHQSILPATHPLKITKVVQELYIFII